MIYTAEEIRNKKIVPLRIPLQWQRFLGDVNNSTRIMISGAPGSRKSSLVADIADMVSTLGSTLYVMSEESIAAGTLQKRLRLRKLRFTNVFVLETIYLHEIEKTLSDALESGFPYKFVFVDSLNEIRNSDQKKVIPETLTLPERYRNTFFAFVLQSTKSRETYKGDGSIEHYVDTMIFCKEEEGKNYIATVGKNRFRRSDATDEKSI